MPHVEAEDAAEQKEHCKGHDAYCDECEIDSV